MTARELLESDIGFRGILYGGFILTAEGPKVLEYNTRFGDPETQVLLPRLENDLAEVLLALAKGELDSFGGLSWSRDVAVSVVIASGGYPGDYATGKPISGLAEAAALPGVTVYHAGTAIAEDGTVVSAGGRVLNVTATAPEFDEAVAQGLRGRPPHLLRRLVLSTRHRAPGPGQPPARRLAALSEGADSRMFSERLLTAVMRRTNDRYLTLEPVGRRPAAGTGPGTPVSALRPHPVLRAAVPVLLVQPLPVQRRARDPVLQAAARRDADGRGPGLRLPLAVRGRRHADDRHRRAGGHDRPGQVALLDQGGLLRDQPQPPLPAVDRSARRPGRPLQRRRPGARRRAAAPDGPLRQVRLGGSRSWSGCSPSRADSTRSTST